MRNLFNALCCGRLAAKLNSRLPDSSSATRSLWLLFPFAFFCRLRHAAFQKEISYFLWQWRQKTICANNKENLSAKRKIIINSNGSGSYRSSSVGSVGGNNKNKMQSTTKAQQKQFKFGQRQPSWVEQSAKPEPEPEPELELSWPRANAGAAKLILCKRFLSHNFLICLSATAAKEKCCLFLGAARGANTFSP